MSLEQVIRCGRALPLVSSQRLAWCCAHSLAASSMPFLKYMAACAAGFADSTLPTTQHMENMPTLKYTAACAAQGAQAQGAGTCLVHNSDRVSRLSRLNDEMQGRNKHAGSRSASVLLARPLRR